MLAQVKTGNFRLRDVRSC